MYLAPLVSAVTSAPTFFPAVRLTGEEADDDFIGDAAFILNAPGNTAYLHARTNVPDAKEFVVVAIGTQWQFSITDDTIVYGGVLQWFGPLLDMVFRGQDSISLRSLERYEKFVSEIDVVVMEMEPRLPVSVSGFDPSKDMIERIRRAGKDYVRDNSEHIDEVIALLAAGGVDSGNMMQSADD